MSLLYNCVRKIDANGDLAVVTFMIELAYPLLQLDKCTSEIGLAARRRIPPGAPPASLRQTCFRSVRSKLHETVLDNLKVRDYIRIELSSL